MLVLKLRLLLLLCCFCLAPDPCQLVRPPPRPLTLVKNNSIHSTTSVILTKRQPHHPCTRQKLPS